MAMSQLLVEIIHLWNVETTKSKVHQNNLDGVTCEMFNYKK